MGSDIRRRARSREAEAQLARDAAARRQAQIARVRAEIRRLEAERTGLKGAAKGLLTKKLKALQVTLAAL
jgi:hypothetical protein